MYPFTIDCLLLGQERPRRVVVDEYEELEYVHEHDAVPVRRFPVRVVGSVPLVHSGHVDQEVRGLTGCGEGVDEFVAVSAEVQGAGDHRQDLLVVPVQPVPTGQHPVLREGQQSHPAEHCGRPLLGSAPGTTRLGADVHAQ